MATMADDLYITIREFIPEDKLQRVAQEIISIVRDEHGQDVEIGGQLETDSLDPDEDAEDNAQVEGA